MIFKLEGNRRLVVVLNTADLEDLHLTYEELCHPTCATLCILQELLEIGSMRTGFCPENGSLELFIAPQENGCRISFYLLEPMHISYAPVEPVVFAFEDVYALLKAAAGLFNLHSHRIFKSSLYRMETGYRLLVRTLDSPAGPVTAQLAQYGRHSGQGELAAAYLEEHATNLIEGNAIDVLAHLEASGQTTQEQQPPAGKKQSTKRKSERLPPKVQSGE